jgi:hypothetical protein
MIKLFLATVFLFSSIAAFANTSSDSAESFLGESLKRREALTITDVKVYQLSAVDNVFIIPVNINPVAEVIMVIDNLLAIGKKIWPIIEAGAPVVTTKMAPPISVIPNIDGTNVVLAQMENWSVPRMVSYRISFTNALDMEIVGFTYTVYFQHGGSYLGKGKYIANLKIQASNIAAMWGSKFDASSELVGISNAGTTEAPVASAIVQVSYVAKGIFNQFAGARSFYIDGAGHMSPIND